MDVFVSFTNWFRYFTVLIFIFAVLSKCYGHVYDLHLPSSEEQIMIEGAKDIENEKAHERVQKGEAREGDYGKAYEYDLKHMASEERDNNQSKSKG